MFEKPYKSAGGRFRHIHRMPETPVLSFSSNRLIPAYLAKQIWQGGQASLCLPTDWAEYFA
jgi:hypothetical protein